MSTIKWATTYETMAREAATKFGLPFLQDRLKIKIVLAGAPAHVPGMNPGVPMPPAGIIPPPDPASGTTPPPVGADDKSDGTLKIERTNKTLFASLDLALSQDAYKELEAGAGAVL